MLWSSQNIHSYTLKSFNTLSLYSLQNFQHSVNQPHHFNNLEVKGKQLFLIMSYKIKTGGLIPRPETIFSYQTLKSIIIR